MPPITPSRLSDVGGHEHNGIWMFKDGSRGRFIAYAGTFMYLDWNVAKWIKVRISPPLKAEELYEIWGDYGSIVNVPKLVFVTTAGAPVSVGFHPEHGSWGGLENVGQALAIAIHKRYPERKIEMVA
jgi:hypothetical protein